MTATPETAKAKQDAIHCHFGLSYANYLVLPRTLLQSRDMTESELFAAGVEVTGDDELGHGPDTKYHQISDGEELDGDSYGFRPGKDPVPHYNRGRTRVEPRLGGGQ